ncbi:MAG: hypothetical protein AVDCRST_MAG68-4886 [uncultured Gemmatimonadetes bacterium]|uniref:Uncharacterized protein n=1 Tax=uncultured Gemmatimonadota bacterium TaxID=203437 RepID=A0A6J4MTC4_9BACT|nr:MAG: hypothetical protein AVDCRST_MAG68-4886 [uncultured Gemmatimonadota bacterium]
MGGRDTSFMQQPEAFRRFGRGIHQEIVLEAATVEEIVRLLLSGLTAAERGELRAYISHLTATLTPAEIKGVLNRATFDAKFSTKGAAALLRAAQEQLSAAT